MAITKNSGRQEVIAARVVVTLGTGNDVAAQGTYGAIDVPEGAIVVGGFINVSDATTATVDIHVGDGGVANRYADNIDGGATGLTALTITGYKYPAADTIDVMVDTADPTAAGQFELVVLYVVDGRVGFSQG
jgi:hypothetical protein